MTLTFTSELFKYTMFTPPHLCCSRQYVSSKHRNINVSSAECLWGENSPHANSRKEDANDRPIYSTSRHFNKIQNMFCAAGNRILLPNLGCLENRSFPWIVAQSPIAVWIIHIFQGSRRNRFSACRVCGSNQLIKYDIFYT